MSRATEPAPRRIGVIADTHGLLRPEAAAFLQGCEHILHAGDVCDAATLAAIARIAPVTAVRGNNDKGDWADDLAERELLRFGSVLVYVLHDRATLDIDLRAAGVRVLVSGHTHQPRVEERDGVLFVNPGSAGPRRFKLPVAIGELVITGDTVAARTLELAVRPAGETPGAGA